LNDLMNDKRQSNIWITYFENENIMNERNLGDGLAIDETEEWENIYMISLKEPDARETEDRKMYLEDNGFHRGGTEHGFVSLCEDREGRCGCDI
jgi:hypothetical protein